MIETLVYLVVYILVLGLVIGLLVYVIDNMPFIPPPFRQIARIIVIVVGCIILILLLLNLVGMGPPIRRLG